MPKNPPPSETSLKRGAAQNFERLFGAAANAGRRNAPGLMLIERSRIQTAPQPRTHFDAEGIAQLAASIRERREKGEGVEGTGILQPLLVAPLEEDEGRFRLIAGERRFRAASEAGLEEVPAIVVPLRPNELVATQLIENLQRQNLNALDEGRAIDELMRSQKQSIRDVARTLGKTRGYITNRLDLLKMGSDVQQMVSSREDTLRSASHIDRVHDAVARAALIRAVLEENIAEREVVRRIEVMASADSASLSSREDNEALVTNNAQQGVAKNREREDNPANPIDSELRSVISQTARAMHQLEGAKLTVAERNLVLRQVETVQRQLDRIRSLLN